MGVFAALVAWASTDFHLCELHILGVGVGVYCKEA